MAVRALPEISMIRLREIGSASWDAMVALGPSMRPDEFDRYLATAATRLWNGDSEGEVADYLMIAETGCLGVDTGSGMRERALRHAEGSLG